MATQVKPSEFDGQSVVYVDKLHLQHSGVIVGQSQDEKWFFVQSDREDTDLLQWHFKIAREVLPGVRVVRG